MKNSTLLFFILLMACRDGEAPMRAPNLQSPVVTGIRLTDEMGNEIGAWGDPSDKPQDPSGGLFITTYPNPSDGIFTIRYDVLKRTHVKMWAVRSRTNDESKARIAGGTVLFSPDDLADRVLVNQVKETGHYSVLWSRDNNIAEDFYRIYLKSDESFVWVDVAIFAPCNLPLDLQDFFGWECD